MYFVRAWECDGMSYLSHTVSVCLFFVFLAHEMWYGWDDGCHSKGFAFRKQNHKNIHRFSSIQAKSPAKISSNAKVLCASIETKHYFANNSNVLIDAPSKVVELAFCLSNGIIRWIAALGIDDFDMQRYCDFVLYSRIFACITQTKWVCFICSQLWPDNSRE